VQETRTRISAGDVQRELRISRAILDRLLRDYALPAPETVAGARTWPAESMDEFRRALARDRAEAESRRGWA
jgi:hypothetical protein